MTALVTCGWPRRVARSKFRVTALLDMVHPMDLDRHRLTPSLKTATERCLSLVSSATAAPVHASSTDSTGHPSRPLFQSCPRAQGIKAGVGDKRSFRITQASGGYHPLASSGSRKLIASKNSRRRTHKSSRLYVETMITLKSFACTKTRAAMFG